LSVKLMCDRVERKKKKITTIHCDNSSGASVSLCRCCCLPSSCCLSFGIVLTIPLEEAFSTHTHIPINVPYALLIIL
jgi:hypothetical protein